MIGAPGSALSPISPELGRLLDDELRFSPSFRGIYSNHLAMELVALAQLGASADVLQRVFDLHAANESELRDDRPSLDELIHVVEHDRVAAVRSSVAGLLDAPSTALFHPVIRLAYGLDAGHDGQVAAALLDWTRRRHVLALPEAVTGRRRMTDVAGDLARHAGGSWPPTYDLDGVARRAALASSLEGLAVDGDTLDDVSRFALTAHVTAEAFVTLHLVTGARAVRVVAGLLDDDVAIALAAHTARAMTVAFAAVGAPPLLDDRQLDEIRRSALPSVEEIAERAIADLDPHVVKLSNVALVEEERSGDPLYRYVAARVVDAVPRAA